MSITSNVVDLTYEVFKAIVIAKGMLWQYQDTVQAYCLFAYDGPAEYTTTIYKNSYVPEGLDVPTEAARITDFETNYQPTANQKIVVKSSLVDPSTGYAVSVTSDGKLKVDSTATVNVATKPCIRFSEEFENDLIDTVNRWSSATSGSASYAILNNIMTLSVTTSASDYINFNTTPSFIPIDGNEYLSYRSVVNFGDVYDNNNVREFGFYATYGAANSLLFRLVGTTLSAVIENGGSETVTNLAIVVDANWHTYEVRVTAQQNAYFYVDGVLLHTAVFGSDVIVKTNKFDAYMANTNSASTTNTPSLKITNITVSDYAGSLCTIIGTDQNRVSRNIATDQYGRIVTVGPATLGSINVYKYDGNIGPLKSNLWRKVLTNAQYTGFTVNLIQFNSYAGRKDCAARLVREIYMGSYNIGTQSFSQGNTFGSTSVKFAMSIEAEVTVQLSSGAVTLTMTYTNQANVAGRTATCVMSASDPIGVKRPFILQAGDFGVKAITAMSRNASVTGTVYLYGIDELCYHDYTHKSYEKETIFAPNSINIPGGVGGTFNLEITSNCTSAAKRKLSVMGNQYLTQWVVF